MAFQKGFYEYRQRKKYLKNFWFTIKKVTVKDLSTRLFTSDLRSVGIWSRWSGSIF